MKKYAYKTTKLTEHENRIFPALIAVVELDNLYSGQIIKLYWITRKLTNINQSNTAAIKCGKNLRILKTGYFISESHQWNLVSTAKNHLYQEF